MIPVFGLFIVALIEVGLAAMVLVRNPRRVVNRWFAAYAAALAAWGAVNGAFPLVANPPVNLILSRAAFAAAALIAVTFYHFATVFPHPGPPRSRAGQAVRLIGLFICGLSFSPWIVAEVRMQPGAFKLIYGPLHLVFALYFVTSYGWALAHLWRKLRRATGFARAQLQYLFLGTAFACVGGATTNLVVPVLFGSSRFSRYGPYFTLFVVAFTAHAIVRYRLMDIRVVISRTVAYLGGWVLASGVLVGGGVFFSRAVLGDPDLSPALAVFLGLLASLCFVAMAPYAKRLADRYLHRPAYDARQIVREGSRAMGTVADPERVAGAMAEVIGKALRLESLAIVWRREGDAFQVAFTSHMDPGSPWPDRPLSTASSLVRELSNRVSALPADDVVRRAPTREVTALTGDLRAWGAEVAVPVRGEADLIGIILAGPKLSGDPFFQDDYDLLETLASELAIGLRNAQLYHEVVSIKEYNERVLAHMDSGVIAIREDGVLTTFNPAAERITGLSTALVIGYPLGCLDPAFQALLKDGLAGQPDAAREITITHADGRPLPLLMHTSALHDRAGHIRGAIAVFNDLSRLKALEEDKRRADRLAAVGPLATGIAHEIRNPLVAIKTLAELLPERSDDQEFRSTFAKVAGKEIHRIEELLGRLRALAVPAAARLHPLDLRVPIGETLDLLRGEADRRRVRFLTDTGPGLPPVIGNLDQLKQLFLNLFKNGLEAMENGGTLTVTARAETERYGRRTLVTVRVVDTGPGIPTGDLTRVFEPFFTTKSQGTGLGLAICRGIADAHRAALWAEAGPGGVGTAFVIQLRASVAVSTAEALR